MELPKTQEELQAAIDYANGSILRDLAEERTRGIALKKQLGEVETTLAEIKQANEATKAAKEKAELEGKGKYDEALKRAEEAYAKKLDEVNGKLAKADERIRALAIDGEVLKHAANAVDPNDALELFKASHQIELTDTGTAVKAKDGTPILDDAGKPATIESAFTKFLAGKPHLIKPGSNVGGAGSRAGQVNTNTGIPDIMAEIAAAEKAGDKAKVILLKARAMSKQGPHSLEHTPGA